MKVPVEWLRDYVDLPKASKELADSLTMTGTHVEGVGAQKGTEILDLEITTNRPDLLAIRGVAREVSAVTGRALRKVSVKEPKVSKKHLLPLKIQILDRKGCGRYIGRVFDTVKVSASPAWLERKMTWMEQKVINNVVDITNFCLFETGQPLHAFDYDKVQGQKIIVRRAKRGEKIVGINDIEYTLDERILVIADATRAIAIAGVMGGRDTEVSAQTERIILESAHFDPVLVRRASRFLKLTTESSYRFERTIPPGRIAEGSLRASELLAKFAGATAASKAIDVCPLKPDPAGLVKIGYQEIQDVLGAPIAPAKVTKILTSLGFRVQKDSKRGIKVRPSDERRDVKEKVDLIEEVVRIYGFDKIPETIPLTRHEMTGEPKSREFLGIRGLKAFLVAQGLNEVVTYSLVSREMLKKCRLDGVEGLMKIINPLSQEQEFLRPSGLPGFLRAVSYNVNRKEKNLKLFEIGKRFRNGREESILSILLTGRYEFSWLGSRESTLYHLKGILENVFAFLGKELPPWREEPYLPETFEDYAALSSGSQKLAGLAEVHPEVASQWDLPSRVYYAEIALDRLQAAKNIPIRHREIAKFPPARRDVSFLVSKGCTVRDLVEAMEREGAPLLKRVVLFDQYLGKNIPSGKRSLAFSLEYQKPDGTFTDEEIHQVHERVTSLLKTKFQAEIRQ